MNPGKKKINNKNGKFFKVECNICGKYGHRASDYWGNRNKNDNINGNKTARKPRFNGNATTEVKEDTGLLIVGRRREKIKIMTSTTSSREPHSMYKFKKITLKKISKNGLETAERHHTLHIRRKTCQMSKNARSISQW